MAIEAKPSAYPEWNATTGTAGKEQPPGSLRDKGYDDTEKPWARHWNWLMNNIFLWVKHLYTALIGSAGLALPDGVYIYDPAGANSTLSLEAFIVGSALDVTYLHANDRVVVGGVVRDTVSRNEATWATVADAYQKLFTGALLADTYYAYLDGDGVLQLSTVDPSAVATNFPICSVDWDGAVTLNNLVDLRTFPAFVDPAGATRSMRSTTMAAGATMTLAAAPAADLQAATKKYVDDSVAPLTGLAYLAYAAWVTSAGAQAADLGSFFRVGKSKGTITYAGSGASTPDQGANLQVYVNTGDNNLYIILPTGETVDDYYPPTVIPAGPRMVSLGAYDQVSPAVQGAGFQIGFMTDAGADVASACAFMLFKG